MAEAGGSDDRALAPEGEPWDGWGTALKPAHEPIVVARKPLSGTVAQNVLAHGTGALNIDGCRIGWGAGGDQSAARKEQGYSEAAKKALGTTVASESKTGFSGAVVGADSSVGRWPANVIFVHAEECRRIGTTVLHGDQRETGNGTRPAGFGDIGAANGDSEPNAPVYGDEQAEVWDCVEGCPVRLLDEQSGVSRSAGGQIGKRDSGVAPVYRGGWSDAVAGDPGFGDVGGASRFFYCAKVSRAERNAGLEGFEAKSAGIGDARPSGDFSERLHRGEREHVLARNNHPTVKPIALMRWLCRLATPPGGIVLDPFLGSGSTGIAAGLEGLGFIGIEREADYMRIAEARMAFWAEHGEDGLRICAEREARASKREAIEKAGQLSLLA